MKRGKSFKSAGLAILFGLWILAGSSEIQAQSNQALDLSNQRVQDQIRSSGFIASKPIPFLGSIAGSAAAQVNMSQGDLIYIKLEPGRQVKAGDRFQIARWGREIIHPITNKSLGHVVRISGVVVILDGNGQIVPAKISESFFQVRYGDLITSPTSNLPVRMPIRHPKKIKGTVVASPEEEENVTERVSVYIDRGAQDGVLVGDLFTIYQMPYYTEEIKDGNEKLPLLRAGEGVVVLVNAENSTMLITKSFQAIYIGDQIVSGRGK